MSSLPAGVFVRIIQEALASAGWEVKHEGSLGRRADLVAQRPDGDLVLVEIKAPSRRVSFSQLAQLAEYVQLAGSVDQIPRARGVLITDGEVSESVRAYARQAGISIVLMPQSAEAIGERVVAALASNDM